MIAILGAGAFGTALAVALAKGGKAVTLLARSDTHCKAMTASRENVSRLAAVRIPASVKIAVAHQALAMTPAETILVAVPTQTMIGVLSAFRSELAGKSLVACCKGFDVTTGEGATAMIARAVPGARAAILSGPSFAADIGRGLPTALTIADTQGAEDLQAALSTPTLRLYRSNDPTGVEVGGALKNVVAIACGGCIGAGLGDSARAALMTRGMAEMQRLAGKMGAQPQTLMGLSGFGDLALTCTSEMSRNFRFGLALGRGEVFDPKVTVEGVATAQACVTLANRYGLDLPISAQVAKISCGEESVPRAIQALLSRPLRAE